MSTKFLALIVLAAVTPVVAQRKVAVGDWPEVRGPKRDGTSAEKGLVEKWKLNGENFLWRVPYGGRSAPVVFGNHVYVQNPSGRGVNLQERVMCLDPDTGKVVWEYKINLFQSDAPAHRVGWASPAIDPETGNVYAQTVAGMVVALSKEGKLLWERSLAEEWGAFTTHGGRTMSPLVDGDLVIVSHAVSNWGSNGARSHRFIAMNKKTGETRWVSTPGGRPYDTAYALPTIATINGVRMLICGLGDGGVYAIKPQTGEKIWGTVIAKRGINTGVVVNGSTVIVSHGDENLDTSEMGMVAAIDGSQKGEIKTTKWAAKGFLAGFSSPIIDGDRVLQIENGARLTAFDIVTGKQLWKQQLGTVQKAPPVLADGKIYVGTETGKFFILKPSATGCEIVDQDQLGTEAAPEAIIASVAVSNGRVYLVSDSNLYAIGRKGNSAHATSPAPTEVTANPNGTPTHVQVVPTELILKPGDKINFRARLFDEQGRFIREESAATWSLDQLKGTINNGQFVAGSDPLPQGGLVKATVGSLSGSASVRVYPPLPWSENFDAMAPAAVPATWVNATLKFQVRDMNGNKVLVKTTEGSSLLSRARAYFGPSDLANYTVEADINATQKRRQQGDGGVIAQRYVLVLYGNSQMLHLEPWQPEPTRTVKIPFEWKPDTWYRMKLEVQNLPDGKVRARGKVWLASEAEPAAWTIERIDPIPNRQGAPGIYGSALSELYFDNLKVYANK